MVFAKKTLRIAAMTVCTMGLGAGLSACGMSDPAMKMTGPELSHSNMDIIQIATGSDTHMEDVTTLVSLVKAAGLVSTLQTPTGTAPAPFTVFAPTNAAFEKFKREHPDKYAFVTDPKNVDSLKKVLLYHVIPGQIILAKDVKTMTSPPTADGGMTFSVEVGPDGVMLNHNAKVIKTDIMASNGVIHWIDDVLLPPDMQ